jgi:hypothetical protein
LTNVLKSSTQARPGKIELRADRADPKKGILTFGHSATLKKYSEIGEPLKKEYREIIEPQKKKQAI